MTLSRELLEILVCPRCKGPLLYQEEQDLLICESCRLAYPVKDGIPVMLVDEAKPLE